MVDNVNTECERLYAATAAGNDGKKMGFLESANKSAQNDTVTITNADEVVWAKLTIDADGSEETVTLDGNVITLKDSTTGAVSGILIYK